MSDNEARREILEALEQAKAELQRLKMENAKLTRGDIMQDTLLTSPCIAAVGRAAGPAGVAATVAAVGSWKLLKFAWNRWM